MNHQTSTPAKSQTTKSKTTKSKTTKKTTTPDKEPQEMQLEITDKHFRRHLHFYSFAKSLGESLILLLLFALFVVFIALFIHFIL